MMIEASEAVRPVAAAAAADLTLPSLLRLGRRTRRAVRAVGRRVRSSLLLRARALTDPRKK